MRTNKSGRITMDASRIIRTVVSSLFIAAVILSSFALLQSDQAAPNQDEITGGSMPYPCTFSIVARDSVTGELGVAVASRFFAVGSVVPWAKAGVGAVATQSYANTTFGWRGLELLEQGLTPEEAIDKLTAADDDPARRQLGIVAADGKSATYTGAECLAWAGGRHGPNYAAQGNILAG
jgi:hypothetical protein